MVRWGLRVLLLALVCCAVGWFPNSNAAIEVVRVLVAVLLAVGFALLIIAYVQTPQPPEA